MMKKTAVITQKITINALTTANTSQRLDIEPPGDLFNVRINLFIV
jgi:hypothetical protein